MKKLSNPSILTQLLLIISVIMLIPLIFLGYSTYDTYKNDLQSKIISTNFNTLNQAEQNISNLVKDVSSTINFFDNNSIYETLLTNQYKSDIERIKNIRILETQLQSYLSNLNLPNMDIILLGSNDILYSTSNNPPKISTESIKRTYWFEQTREQRDQLNWFIFDRSYFTLNNTHPAVVATKDLYNYVTGDYYGTVIIEIDEYYLYDLYKDIVSDHEFFMIQDSKGNIITTSDRSVQLSLNSTYSIIAVMDENLIYDYQYKDDTYIFLSQPSSISDWTFIKLLPSNQLNSEINYLQKTFFTVYVLCMILIFIGVYFVAFRISKPIKILTNKIQSNYLHSSYSDTTTTPLTFKNAFTSYEVLIDEVDDTVNQLVKNNEARLNAELYALRMQINPHFLYNTLNSIKYLSILGKAHLIEPTITSLVTLLQQTLRKPNEFIRLDEEIQLLKHYVYIQNIRTDNSITINYNISVDDLSQKVPSLFLQPIVENSIFHGIEPTGKSGIISVSTYHENSNFIIEIVDNGVGMDKNTAESLLNRSHSGPHNGFNGIGLLNIHQRLKLYYGGNCGLQITSHPGTGTSVIIRIRTEFFETKNINLNKEES